MDRVRFRGTVLTAVAAVLLLSLAFGGGAATALTYADVNLSTLIAGEDQTNGVMKVEQQFSPCVISTATTTTCKSGATFLNTVTVTGGTAGTIDVYDNTAGSGTKLASFGSTNALATYTLNVKASTGITVVTGAATLVTVSYRT